ncbi:alkaline phosphatase D family protein [Crossiella cryophila]|uniref:Phosphodiesterase/alkaline phosphatase D-like protein n=1 Tax=Crossiella cryophila TaxID=43355 RepID=A0A7W7CDP8_9PSEU|nr:alkaline phosphatase D family protein [Crossiella cryophila]MBB4679256.1 phosphodiesterase/alkaline phosphatase D-like protein [Crossiella cryophila]
MPNLVLGPLLRHVDDNSATVWVETDGPGTVRVLDAESGTFQVGGHHYALVVLSGLTPDTEHEYQVHLDGEPAWPLPESDFPPSVIRTLPGQADHSVRVSFGSCRFARPEDPAQRAKIGHCALSALATRLLELPVRERPEALLLLGDQIYADETTDRTQQYLKQRRDLAEPPGIEVADYEEYTQLYHESWSEPEIRWLFSTVPTSMIFDDHDVRDDWNTSETWRTEMAAKSWWAKRVRGALASYWVYQHLGNLSPTALAKDEVYQQVQALHGADAQELLEAHAQRWDTEIGEHKHAQWSFCRDFGPVRLLMVDSRAGRILRDGRRKMLDDEEFAWLTAQLAGAGTEYRHLLLGSSLPWLLPPVIHHLQARNEHAATRPGRRGRLAERIRQLGDFDHWASFRESFDQLSQVLHEAAAKTEGTVAVLSGDVHHSYVARTTSKTPVHQLTCSPLRNAEPALFKPALHLGWWRLPAALMHAWTRLSGVPAQPTHWHKTAGPYFGNLLATLDLTSTEATITFERATETTLTEVTRQRLH